MSQRLGIFSQWAWGEWADRAAINRNADDLMVVETSIDTLQQQVAMQAREILQLRAMLMGLADVLHAKAPFDHAELEAAVRTAYTTLTAPPPGMPQGTQMTVCARCRTSVPLSATNVTALGNVCDACS